jgi:hypothetical protein
LESLQLHGKKRYDQNISLEYKLKGSKIKKTIYQTLIQKITDIWNKLECNTYSLSMFYKYLWPPHGTEIMLASVYLSFIFKFRKGQLQEVDFVFSTILYLDVLSFQTV